MVTFIVEMFLSVNCNLLGVVTVLQIDVLNY